MSTVLKLLSKPSFAVIVLVFLTWSTPFDGNATDRTVKRNTADNDKRVALVIGNGGYKSAPLRNPVNDAEDMSALLERLGFTVIKEIDADKRTMLQGLGRFSKKLNNADVGLFYFRITSYNVCYTKLLRLLLNLLISSLGIAGAASGSRKATPRM